MAIRGIFASHSGIVGDRVGDFSSRMLTLGYGGQVPITALSSGTPKVPTTDTSYSWRENMDITGNTTVTAAVTNVATSLPVADSQNWIVNSIILNQITQERMFVVGVTGNNVEVIRGFQNTVAAAIAINHPLQQVSVAFAEGSRGAQSVATRGQSRTSYVQIFKRAHEITGTATAVKMTHGPAKAQNAQEAAMFLAEDIEYAALLGRPSVQVITTTDGQSELRTTTGLIHAIDNYGGNVVSPMSDGVAGRLNMKVINDFIRTLFERNIKGQPNERVTYCGNGMLSMIQEMVMDMKGYQIFAAEDKFGIDVVTIITPFGRLKLTTHPLLNQNPLWTNDLIAMHPAGMRKRELRGLRTVNVTAENQPGSRDAEGGHMLTELGFEWSGMPCFGRITGATHAGSVAPLPQIY